MAKPRYPAHPLVEKLTSVSDDVAAKILGYFGSTDDGVVKVYLSLDDLSSYYAIREDDIVQVEDAPPDELPHGGSAIWVKANARVELCVNQRTTVEARYLTGDMSARMAGGPAVASQAFVQRLAGPQGQFSIWPCSVLVGACLASNDMPCANTEQYWCPGQFATANSCFTCAGYTCVRECNSVAFPPTDNCTAGRPITFCCQVWSRDVCPR